jgi:hypothetical protein
MFFFFLLGLNEKWLRDNHDSAALCLKWKCSTTSARLNSAEVLVCVSVSFNTEDDQHVFFNA